MQQLEDIEQQLTDENIDLDNYKFVSNIKSMAYRSGDDFSIAIDNAKVSSDIEKRVLLEHEYAHIKSGAMYILDTSLLARKRREYKANVYMVYKIVPIDKLKSQMADNKPIYEIAEYFNVTDDVIIKAIDIYKKKELL